jgi:hypothetical protein
MNDPDYAHIDVVNYLDMHADTIDGKIQPFDINVLMKQFPDLDEFTLNKWKKEWETARQRMLNMKF